MSFLDEISINEAIALYYEKHNALRHGDMTKLIELKNKCPDIFIKENDDEIRDIIEYAKQFENSARYKELLKLEMKKKLAIVKND